MTDGMPAASRDDDLASVEVIAEISDVPALQAQVRALSEQLARMTILEGRARHEELKHRRRLLAVQARVAYLEETPAPPTGVPPAPPWVQGRLLRALRRAQHAFALAANLYELAERYEDALSPVSEFVEQLLDQGASRDARNFRLSMLADAEEHLRAFLESAIDVRDFRAIAEAIFEAEDEINLALQQQEDSPLQLSTRTRSVQL